MLAETFKKPKPILGKIRLLPLPGAPAWDGHWETLTTRAEQEATALASSGVDGLIIENFHDAPYAGQSLGTAGAIAMAMLVRRIRQFTALPVGISVLPNDPAAALAIAVNTDAVFIRLPLLSGALLSENGILNSRVQELVRGKDLLKATLPLLLVDVSSDHLVPGAALQGTSQKEGTDRLKHLARVANALPRDLGTLALVLGDGDIGPGELAGFKANCGYETLVENRVGEAPDAWFEQADGLILDAGLRRDSMSQPGLPATIDMTRAEETVNRLRQVVPVTEMDPNIFLQR